MPYTACSVLCELLVFSFYALIARFAPHPRLSGLLSALRAISVWHGIVIMLLLSMGDLNISPALVPRSHLKANQVYLIQPSQFNSNWFGLSLAYYDTAKTYHHLHRAFALVLAFTEVVVFKVIKENCGASRSTVDIQSTHRTGRELSLPFWVDDSVPSIPSASAAQGCKPECLLVYYDENTRAVEVGDSVRLYEGAELLQRTYNKSHVLKRKQEKHT
jgi:hypothetical protein